MLNKTWYSSTVILLSQEVLNISDLNELLVLQIEYANPCDLLDWLLWEEEYNNSKLDQAKRQTVKSQFLPLFPGKKFTVAESSSTDASRWPTSPTAPATRPRATVRQGETLDCCGADGRAGVFRKMKSKMFKTVKEGSSFQYLRTYNVSQFQSFITCYWCTSPGGSKEVVMSQYVIYPDKIIVIRSVEELPKWPPCRNGRKNLQETVPISGLVHGLFVGLLYQLQSNFHTVWSKGTAWN